MGSKKVNTLLTHTFGELKGSQEGLSEDAISGYHFMLGMPYYEDMIEVAQGEDLNKRSKPMQQKILSCNLVPKP